MDKVLFSITCTTCQARLNVRDPAAIGEILTCPRCESFIQVLPPPGWNPLAAGQEPSPPPSTAAEVGGAPGREKPRPPPLPDAADLARLADSAAEIELVLPPKPWEVRAAIVRKWLAWAVLPLGVAIAAVAVWIIFFSSEKVDPVAKLKAELKKSPAHGAPVLALIPKPEAVRAAEQKKWLPSDARLVASLPLSQLAALPDWTRLAEQLDPFCRTSLRPLLDGLGLRAEGVRHLTWASTDLAAPAEAAVVLLELDRDVDFQALAKSGQPTQLLLAGSPCRRRDGSAWKHPFVLIQPRTVLTGREDLLRKLAARAGTSLESQPLERLLQTGLPAGAYAVRIDLAAARQSGFPLPTAVLDLWPAGRQAWRTLWEMSDGIGLAIEPGERLRVEINFTCEGVSSAAKVKVALEELVAAGRQSLSGQAASIITKLQEGWLTAPVGAEYDTLLKTSALALQTAHIEVTGQTVVLRTNWPQPLAALVHTAIESRPAIATDWLAAARAVDQVNHQRLATALDGHQKAEGRWPAAAAGGALLPPETRLSWIAAMLPYFGHADWHRQLESGYQWNDAQNKPVTSRVLEEVVNPSLGPTRTEAGFPTTHYVGVAGVGPDAAGLAASDPRAGVFGFGRTTRPEQITDGAANTIAVLGVTGRLGPWAAGGQATVRALTKPPYVNGPDGFGSGQPDGMWAGMADGAVRFLSKDMDPRVVEQLATIHGGDSPLPDALKRPAEKPVAEKPVAEKPVAASASKPPITDLPASLLPVVTPPSKPAVAVAGNLPPKAPPAKAAPPSEDQPVDEPAEPEVNAQTRLAAVVPQIEMPSVGLVDAVRLIEELSGLLVALDVDAMDRLGVGPGDRIKVALSGKTFREVLDHVAAARGLAVAVANNCVVLTSPAADRGSLKTIPYTVSDLAADPAAVAALADQVRRLVAPVSWRTAGGQGTIKPSGDSLIVDQTDEVHKQLVDFCERLRAARGLPLRSRFSSEKFSLVTRSDRAGAAMAHPVSLNFRRPTPLRKILSRLEEAADVKILVDWAAQAAAGLPVQPRGTLTAENQPLGAALDGLLRPLKLGYRVSNSGLIQVTTQKAIDDRLELEFYPARDLLEAKLAGPALVEKIKSQVAKGTWSDAGGPAEVLLDPPSATLIVLQSQPVQRAIARLLAELRAGQVPAPKAKPAK